MAKRNHVWVIEMLVKGKWNPCASWLSVKQDAKSRLRTWKRNNPDDTFRIKQYISED